MTSRLRAQYGLVNPSLADRKQWEEECLVTPLQVNKKPGTPFSLSQWEEATQTLWLPRNLGLTTLGPAAIDDTTLGTLASPRAYFTSILDAARQQVVACQALLTAFIHPSRRGGLLKLAPGAGKTVVILFTLVHLLRNLHGQWLRTCIIVPTTPLLNQWPIRIAEHTRGLKVGLCHGSVYPEPDCDLVIMLVHSAANKTYPATFYEQFGCVVFDEVHVAGARTFSKALSLFPARYKLGVTGTPQRADGLSEIIEWQVGPLLSLQPPMVHPLTKLRPLLTPYVATTAIQDIILWFDIGVWHHEITQPHFGLQVKKAPTTDTNPCKGSGEKDTVQVKGKGKRKRKPTKREVQQEAQAQLIATMQEQAPHLQWTQQESTIQSIGRPEVKQYIYHDPSGHSRVIQNRKQESIVFLMMRRLVHDARRNDLICESIISMIHSEPRRHVLVVSRQVTHLKLLYTRLQEPPFNLTIDQLGLYYQDTKQQTSELYKQVVLGIDVMVTMGLDLASYTGLVLGLPMGSLDQLEARLCHCRGRTPPFPCLVIDFVDPYGLFENLGWKRYHYFKRKQYRIFREDIQ